MRQFTFTTSTTFNQYVDAVVSRRLPWERLLPPCFPSILTSFTYNTFVAKFHPTCTGIRLWHGQIPHTFELDSDDILALTDEYKKIHFGVAPVVGVSFFPKSVRFIHTNLFFPSPYFFRLPCLLLEVSARQTSFPYHLKLLAKKDRPSSTYWLLAV